MRPGLLPVFGERTHFFRRSASYSPVTDGALAVEAAAAFLYNPVLFSSVAHVSRSGRNMVMSLPGREKAYSLAWLDTLLLCWIISYAPAPRVTT